MIEHTEELGHETLVTVQAGSGGEAVARFIVRLPAIHQLEKGRPIELRVGVDDVHLFAEDGLRISD